MVCADYCDTMVSSHAPRSTFVIYIVEAVSIFILFVRLGGKMNNRIKSVHYENFTVFHCHSSFFQVFTLLVQIAAVTMVTIMMAW